MILISELRGHTRGVNSVAFSPDERRLVSGSPDQTVRVWDTASGEELVALRGHEDAVTSVAFSADGNFVLSGSRDGTVKIWDGRPYSDDQKAERLSERIAKQLLDQHDTAEKARASFGTGKGLSAAVISKVLEILSATKDPVEHIVPSDGPMPGQGTGGK